MSAMQVAFLTVIFLVASSIGVVTGGTSLITVPAILQFQAAILGPLLAHMGLIGNVRIPADKFP